MGYPSKLKSLNVFYLLNGTGSGKSKTTAGNVYWTTTLNSNLQKWTFPEVPGPSGKYMWPTESHAITNSYVALVSTLALCSIVFAVIIFTPLWMVLFLA